MHRYEITNIQDMSQYIAALLARPASSKDSHLNFVSDVVSQQEIADMLKEVTGKEVKPDYVTEEQAHGYIANPDTIPERAKQSRFAADFWYIVRLQQGASSFLPLSIQLLAVIVTRAHCLHCRTGTNKFRRHPSLIHNDRFAEIKTTPLRQYLQGIVEKSNAGQ